MIHFILTFIQYNDIIRYSVEVTIWNRNPSIGETVESVLIRNKGRSISVCHEAQGESVAISNDTEGFYTISEAKGEDSAREIDVPTYYYSLSEGKT